MLEVIIIQALILGFLIGYMVGEEQAIVTINYTINVNNETPTWLWESYWREQDAKFDAELDYIERDIRHQIFTKRLTGV